MLVKIYPENPNLREIDKVVNIMRDGGLVIYPTDTVYAIKDLPAERRQPAEK